MTLNYLQDTKRRLVAMQNDIHTALGETQSAKEYGLFSRDAYPFWRNITGDMQVTLKEHRSQKRVHTIYMVWTLGATKTGAEGRLEEKCDEWIVTVLDFFQARPDLSSSTITGYPLWADEEGAYISAASGLLHTPVSQDGAKQTDYIQFTLIAPFRVGA